MQLSVSIIQVDEMKHAGWLRNRQTAKLLMFILRDLFYLLAFMNSTAHRGGGGEGTRLYSSGLIRPTFTCFSVLLLCHFLLNFSSIPLEQELFGATNVSVSSVLILKHWRGRRTLLPPVSCVFSVACSKRLGWIIWKPNLNRFGW